MRNFINTWIIIPEFENPEEFCDDPVARQWASVIGKEFTCSVDSIVLSSTGQPIAEGEIETLCSPRGAAAYLKKVDQALQ